MEMPSPCARCGVIFELNDMWPSEWENLATGSRVECDDCHRPATEAKGQDGEGAQ